MGFYDGKNSQPLSLFLITGSHQLLIHPMGICNCSDVFQEKLSVLMFGLEYTGAYVNDFLVFSKDRFENQLEY
jgi:hypothetical protein